MTGRKQGAVFSIFWRTLRYFNYSRSWLGLIALLGVLSSIFAALVPLLLGVLVDAIVAQLGGGDSKESNAVLLVLLLFLGMLVRDAIRILYGFQVTRLTNSLMVRARREISARSIVANPRSRSGDPAEASYVMNSDVQQLALLYSHPLTTVISDLLDTFFMSVAIAMISWQLLGIVVLPLFPILWISSWAGSRQKRLAGKVREEELRSVSMLDRALRNIVTVRVFGGEKRELRALSARFNAMDGALGASNRNLAALMAYIGVLRLGATILAMMYATSAVQQGDIPVGTVAVLMIYLTRYYSPAINLSKAYQGMQRGAVSAQRVMQYMAEIPSPKPACRHDAPADVGPVSFELTSGVVELPDGRTLEVPDFSINRSGLVVVLGESGVGKTSFLRALLGVPGGELKGDLKITDSSSLDHSGSSNFAVYSYAGQDDELIGGTICEAVTYPGSGSVADFGRVGELLNRLGLASVADRDLEHEAKPLSGGEARRVVLARALFRSSPVLLADEVTSNLDAVSQKVVENVLLAESGHRIVILVTHNPSQRLLDSADIILHLEGARTEVS